MKAGIVHADDVLLEQVREETQVTLDRQVPSDQVDNKADKVRLVRLAQLVQKDLLERLDFKVDRVSLAILDNRAQPVKLDFLVRLVHLEGQALLDLQEQVDLQGLQDQLGLLVP